MRIAIVIPVLNQIEFFKQTVESICKTAPNKHHVRIVVVDSASTEPIKDAALNAEMLNPWMGVDYIRLDENLGVTKPWNIGIQRALSIGADVVCVSNSDVVYGKDVIRNCAECAFEEGAAFPYSIQGGPKPKDFDSRADEAAKLPLHSQKFNTGGFAGWCFFLSRKTIEQIGMFDEQFTLWYQDTDYHNRLHAAGITPWELRCCLLHHYESRTIISMPGKFECHGWRKQDEKNFFLKYPHQKG